MTRRCVNCHEPIESFNGYDYAIRGVSWRHEKTREVYCRTTTAEPMPLACPLCRMHEPNHAPTCLAALTEAASSGSSTREADGG